jgi:hypothetical protein
MHTPKRGEIVVVSEIPPCYFCNDGTPGPYDFRTAMGPWANGCESCWHQFAAAAILGEGYGQLWITADQVPPLEQQSERDPRDAGEVYHGLGDFNGGEET